ncbi:MAG: enoyl-CoA hydratase-related protein [Parvibaculum sp.]|uniref:enoyl-CoA hydratase-related protein n=1 Tax=Parvibaculum sp. TaxID=2024848 RepID=UPI003918E352
MSEHVLRAIDKGVMTVTLNRADKKNALTEAMYSALGDALEAAAGDKSVRVVLFTGSGDSFTAGNDLGDFAAAGAKPADANEGERPVGRFLRLIATAENL